MKSLNNQTSALAEDRSVFSIVKSMDDPPPHRNYAGDLSRLAIATRGGLRMIRLSDILFVRADSNYAIIFTQQDEQYLVSKSLKHIAQRCSAVEFLRSHQSYLVNCNHIESLSSGSTSVLTLTNGTKIPVSRRLFASVKNYLINQFSI